MTPGGTQITDWVLTVKNGAASCASVQVANAANSGSVLWSNTLNANEWLRFTSETQRIEVSTDSGATWTKNNANTIGLIPKVQGGVSNVVTLTGPTTGTHEYSFTAKG